MLGQKLPRLERADIFLAEEAMHLRAEVPQPNACVARLPPLIEFGDRLGDECIVVMQLLEREQPGYQRVPALLASTPGVSRKSRELRSFFSATMRFSRKYCATTGAGMPCSA